MRQKQSTMVAIILAAVFTAVVYSGALAATPPAGTMVQKNCMKCHQGFSKMDHVLAGNLSSKSMKAKSLQVKIGKKLELVKFTPETVVKNVPDMKALKGTPAMRVHYKDVGKDKVATEIVVKPKIKVPKEQLIQVDELAELVAKGPDKGEYTLVDSRPPAGYGKGYIPTAISIPFNKMKEMEAKLPKDKNKMIIFYCQGYR